MGKKGIYSFVNTSKTETEHSKGKRQIIFIIVQNSKTLWEVCHLPIRKKKKSRKLETLVGCSSFKIVVFETFD